MRHSFLLSALLLAGSPAEAGVTSQVVASVSGRYELSEHTTLVTQGNFFWAPGNKQFFFTYLGPWFTVSEHYSVVPLVGLVANWPEPADVTPNLALLNIFSAFDGRASLLLDTELLLTHLGLDYLAYYGLSWQQDDFTFGLHLEQINTYVTFGPNISLAVGEFFRYSVELHHNVPSGNTAVRVILSVSFSEE